MKHSTKLTEYKATLCMYGVFFFQFQRENESLGLELRLTYQAVYIECYFCPIKAIYSVQQ
jgi:hypothetical protein